MDNCSYQLNINGGNFKFESIQDLTTFILQELDSNTNIKYSLDITPKQGLVSVAIKETFSENKFKNNKGLTTLEFLKTPQDTGKGRELLAPFFDTDNYIKNEVKKATKEALEKGEIDSNEVEKFEEVIKAQLEEDLIEDEFAKNLGKNIHSLVLGALERGINSQEVNAAIVSFIEFIGNYNNTQYSPDQIARYNIGIKRELLKLLSFINSKGTPIIRPRLIHYDSEVKSSPDIVIVDQNGNPHIFDITLSRKPTSEWNSAKLLLQDYKLGVERQMLELICSTKKSGLYLAPFYLQDFSLDNFMLGEISDRTIENKQLNYVGGRISETLKVLLPGKYTELHLDDSLDKDNDTLIGALLTKNYAIKSKWIIENKEYLIKKIKDKKRPNEPYILFDYLQNKSIKIDKEEDIEKEVEAYLLRYNSDKHSEVERLKRALLNKMKANSDSTISVGKGSSEVIINSTFDRYMKMGWELVDNDIFTNQGILVFKNNVYNTIEAVSITTNELNTLHNLEAGNTILGKFFNNTKATQDKNILQATTANIEIMRTLAILNNSPELFGNYKLGNIKVLNYMTDHKWDTTDTAQAIYNFNQLYKAANKNNELGGIPNRFESREIKLSNPIEELYKEIWSQLAASDNPELKSLAKGTRPDVIDAKLEWFKKVKNLVIEKHPELVENPEKIPDFRNEWVNLYRMISEAIVYYSGITFHFDGNVSRFGIRFADIGHLPQTLLFGEGREYDAQGNKVVGLLQGSYFSTTDSSPSKDRTQIFDYVSLGHTMIRDAYQKIQGPTVKKTTKYYEDCGRSGLEKVLIGNATKYHERLFEQLGGKLDSDFRAKNPYSLDSDLKAHERDYLKYILWEMYKFKDSSLAEDYKKMSYTEFEKSERFKEITTKNEYTLIPLMKKLDMSKWGSLTTENFWKSVGKRWEDIKDFVDPRQITETQRIDAENHVLSCNKMYNEFNMGAEVREKLISEYGVNYFEVNLDTILLKYSFASIRENVMDEVLTIINSAMMALKYHGYKSGNSKELNEALEDMYKQFRISIYGVEPFKGEITEPLAVVKQVQRLASIAFITMRPVLMLKELITGTIKNVSYAWTKVYGDDSFTISDLSAAYNKVLFSKSQSFQDFNMVDELNLLYGIANMDTNSVVKKSKTDRSGLFKFFSEHLYWMNTAPDYVNRLTLFVAKMIHDGCYDAHSIDKNGKLIYDPRKDKRFKVYFEKRQQYNYKWTQNDTVYNDQRSLYISLLESFNKENKVFGKAELDEKIDLIPKAYSHEDRESIKVFADMAYGFYDHERSSLWKHTVMGSIFGQFLTYWPAKVKYYFGKEVESKTGSRQQKFQLDADGNKQYLWLKDVFDEEGNLIGTEDTTENTGRKSMHFIKGTHEGLFYSLVHCVRDVLHGNLDKTPIQRKRRAVLAMHDLLMGLLLAAFVRILLEDFEGEKDKSYVDQAMQGTTRAFYKATKEFDPFASVFTAFKWEPAFVGMTTKVVDSFAGIFSGNSTLEDLFRKNLKMLEILPEPAE